MYARNVRPVYPDYIERIKAQYAGQPQGAQSQRGSTSTMQGPQQGGASPLASLGGLGLTGYQLGAFNDISGKGAFYDSVMKDIAPGGMSPATAAQEASLDAQFGVGGGAFGGQSAAVPALEGLGANGAITTEALGANPTGAIMSQMPMEAYAMPEAVSGMAPLVDVSGSATFGSFAPAAESAGLLGTEAAMTGVMAPELAGAAATGGGLLGGEAAMTAAMAPELLAGGSMAGGVAAGSGAAATGMAAGGAAGGAGAATGLAAAAGPIGLGALGVYALGSLFDWW